MRNSGVSLITLIVTIMVIIILATIVMSSGTGSVEEARKTQVQVELKELKEAVNRRMIEHEKNPSQNPLIGMKVSGDLLVYLSYIDDITNEQIQDFAKNLEDENVEFFRLVDSQSAVALGVESIDKDNGYIVDYSTGKVYGSVNMEKLREEGT